MKKCNKCVSVFKIEGLNSLFAVIFVCFALVLAYYSSQSRNMMYIPSPSPQISTPIVPTSGPTIDIYPSYPYTNLPPRDVLLNPYAAPLRDERYFVPQIGYGGRVPINVSTNVGAVNTDYRQVGILTPVRGSSLNQILPLMGRPLYTTRSKWQYYTISNQHNNVKLPILVNGRKGTEEYGIDQLSEGDKVFVQGIKEKFKITLYDNDTIQYLPYL
jgi:hypothetical protein